MGFLCERDQKYADAAANYESAWRMCRKRNPAIGSATAVCGGHSLLSIESIRFPPSRLQACLQLFQVPPTLRVHRGLPSRAAAVPLLSENQEGDLGQGTGKYSHINDAPFLHPATFIIMTVILLTADRQIPNSRNDRRSLADGVDAREDDERVDVGEEGAEDWITEFLAVLQADTLHMHEDVVRHYMQSTAFNYLPCMMHGPEHCMSRDRPTRMKRRYH